MKRTEFAMATDYRAKRLELSAFNSSGKSDLRSNKVSDENERYIYPEKIEQTMQRAVCRVPYNGGERRAER